MPHTASSVPEDAAYLDEINHYIHEECRKERDEKNRRMEELRAGIDTRDEHDE